MLNRYRKFADQLGTSVIIYVISAISVITIMCGDAKAAEIDPLTVAKHQKITGMFSQSLSFDVKGSAGRTVIYGSKLYGYFSTSFKRKKNKISFMIIPPGYQEPIDFYLCPTKVRRKDCTKLASRKFNSPLPMGYRSMEVIIENGKFTSNYFLLSASLPKSRIRKMDEILLKIEEPLRNSNRFSVIFILNRYGEIVWSYTPVQNRRFFYAYLGAKSPKAGTVGYVLGKKDGFFELINMQGKSIHRIDSKNSLSPFSIHHDFTFGPKGELLTISNRYFEVSGQGIKGAKRNKRVSFLSNTVVEVNKKKSKAKVRFDVLDHYLPQKEEFWLENKIKKRFVLWGKPKADRDFAHMNSISFEKDRGFLISLKHLDRIILVDDSLRRIKWSIGPSKNDTYQTKGESWFSHQHDPKFLKSGAIVLFDNGFRKKRSRILAVMPNPETKKVEIVWQYNPQPTLFADNRSSVEEIENGNIVSLFVGPNKGGKKSREDETRDYLIEYNPKTNKEVARMRLDFMTRSGGFRAIPLQTLDQELYLEK